MSIIDQDDLFDELFSSESLFKTFNEKFGNSGAKGIDRLNGMQYSLRAQRDLIKTSEKCLNESFRFSPYLEMLKSKGRGKNPRVISIPTVRDRVVLRQLNIFLCKVFPEYVPKSVASTYIRALSSDFLSANPDNVYICSCDIEGFYDNIIKDRLIKKLSTRINSKKALNLIVRSLLTPTSHGSVKKNQRKEFFNKDKGVPQGLSISNVLASIYMSDIDTSMKGFNVNYYRYVDDVLIYGDRDCVSKAYSSIRRKLKLRGLNTHPPSSPKTHLGYLNQPFGFLGYVFKGNDITVRDTTLEAFLQSIAARFSDFTHNKNRRLKKYSHLSIDDLKEIFVEELNEKITGAISGNKRYGWVAYYSNINDLSLLHKIDFIAKEMFSRLSDFDYQPPAELKKISRSYYEIKFNPQGGYIRNYDKIETLKQKTDFLVSRGRIAPDERLTRDQIEERFERYKATILSRMQADEGEIYPK
ncbi:maturase [Lelliottia sp. AC1]|jgi:retron-type reverse transcriptase|uniref:reverse transcriptase domain-containing protein n=1 Tax=Lelliottia sp. AC1 TaxID=2067959 RepID=UPI00200D544C|nr:reverse transcriptase domain-containing protein [Lelliottia sp. AC1]UQC69368.1 maturase [Lelliottia sp. AC1]